MALSINADEKANVWNHRILTSTVLACMCVCGSLHNGGVLNVIPMECVCPLIAV